MYNRTNVLISVLVRVGFYRPIEKEDDSEFWQTILNIDDLIVSIIQLVLYTKPFVRP